MQNKTFEANKKKYPGARIPKISYLTFCFLFFMDSKTVFFFVFLVFWFFSFLVFLGLVEAECTDMEEECTPDTVMDLVCLTMAQSIKTEVQTSLIVVGTTHFVKAEAFQTLHCNVFFTVFAHSPGNVFCKNTPNLSLSSGYEIFPCWMMIIPIKPFFSWLMCMYIYIKL
jgi:hypothetical protein